MNKNHKLPQHVQITPDVSLNFTSHAFTLCNFVCWLTWGSVGWPVLIPAVFSSNSNSLSFFFEEFEIDPDLIKEQKVEVSKKVKRSCVFTCNISLQNHVFIIFIFCDVFRLSLFERRWLGKQKNTPSDLKNYRNGEQKKFNTFKLMGKGSVMRFPRILLRFPRSILDVSIRNQL